MEDLILDFNPHGLLVGERHVMSKHQEMIMKKRYGPETAASYPATGPDRPGYAEYAAALAEGCSGRDRLRILDLGCGAGRYFHCLQNVALLVGIDISPDMLLVADRVCRELATLTGTLCVMLEADLQSVQFTPNSFDFIYSIGVLGDTAVQIS